jgi:hypothetical protein
MTVPDTTPSSTTPTKTVHAHVCIMKQSSFSEHSNETPVSTSTTTDKVEHANKSTLSEQSPTRDISPSEEELCNTSAIENDVITPSMVKEEQAMRETSRKDHLKVMRQKV